MAESATATGDGAADRGSEYRWRILTSALIVQITISIVAQGFPALGPYAKADMHLNAAQVGLFATILNVGTMIALLPAGWAVDVLGERRVLLVGGVATGVFTILASFAPAYAVLLPMLILVGLVAATPTPAGSTAVINAFSLRDRGFVMSIRQTGIPIGGAIAALLLPPVAASAGWRRALVVAGVLSIAGAVAGRVIVRRAPRRTNAERGQAGSLRSVASWDATYVGLSAIFLTMGQYVLGSFIALYLLDSFGMPIALGSLFLVVANVGGACGRLFWGTVSDRVFGGRRALPLMVVSLSSAIGFALLAWLPRGTPAVLLLLLVLVLGACTIGWNGVYITLLSELSPPDRRARTVAYGMTISQVGIFGGPFAFGLLVETVHSYRIAWSVVSVGMLLAIACLRPVREQRRIRTGRPTVVVT